MAKFEGQLRDLGEIPQGMLSAVVERVRASADLWADNDSRFVANHADSQHIVFKFPDRYPYSHVPASYTQLWDEWEELLQPVIDAVNQRYGYLDSGTAKIMLSRLRSGGHVPAHIDTNPSSAVPHKVHVPLISTPDVIFFIDGIGHILDVGRAYEINNLLVHSVDNNSDVDRVHLIFETYPTTAPVGLTST